MTFLELLITRRIPWRKHTKPDEVWLCCPFCHDEKFRLGLNWRKNMAHCFNGGCGWRSRKAIPRILKAWRLEVRIESAGNSEGVQEQKAVAIHLPDDFYPLHQIDRSEDPPFINARRYWLKRGFSLGQAKTRHIGASFCGRYAFRIIMPVIYQGTLRGLVTRAFADQEPKYLNSMGDRAVWGLKPAKPKQRLVLAEGIFKALALEPVFAGARVGSLLGHSITEGQMAQIHECGFASVVLWPDPDRPGLEGFLKVAEQMAEAGLKVYIPEQLPRRQADEYTRPELEALATRIVPLSLALRWKYRMEAAKQ